MTEVAGATFAISPLVIMECLVGALRTGNERLQDIYRQAFDPLMLVPLGVPVFQRAARLRAEHRLKTPDAIHLAAALEHGCDELWTNDDRLSRAAGSFARVVGR